MPWGSIQTGEGQLIVLGCFNPHLKLGEKGRDRMDGLNQMLDNTKVLQGVRNLPIRWLWACVGDKKNFLIAPPIPVLKNLFGRLANEDLKITLRVVNFEGREVKSYDKIPKPGEFLTEITRLSRENQQLYELKRKAKENAQPAEPPKPASEGKPDKQGK